MADIFEYLNFQAEMDNEPMRKAAAIALSRSEGSFAFLEKASSRNEFDSRLSLVEDSLNGIIEEACEEFGYDDPAHIAKIVRGQIELLAADAETGDSYYQRRDDLPTAPADGSLSEPSPKLDPGKAGDQWHTFQGEPEVESVRHRNDRQNAQDVADYASDLDESHPLVQRVDADTPMQPEFNVGDNTKVFPKNKNQAQPVTSRHRKRADIYMPSDPYGNYGEGDRGPDYPEDSLLIISDPGHAWLRVPLESAQGLGISEYSYQDKHYAYLEEDSDAGKWLKAHPEINVRGIRRENEPSDDSFVRSLPSFSERSASYRRSSDMEAEFRKCVEDCVKNGMPAEAALNHDEFAGLQETTKFNIINEYRGDKVTASKKKVRKSK